MKLQTSPQLAEMAGQWKIGDEIEISENQKFLMKETEAVSILTPMKIQFYPKEDLEVAFRKFLHLHPVLCIKYIQREGKVVQKLVAAEDVPIEIKYKKIEFGKTYLELKNESFAFLKKPCDFFNGELVRLVAYVDESTMPKQLYLGVGIHYAVIDMYTNILLSDRLYKHLNDVNIDANLSSNFDFAAWQKKYLSSVAARESRKYWLSMLKGTVGETATPLHTAEVKRNQFFSQKIIICKENLLALNQFVRNIGFPLSALLLATHQKLINRLCKNKGSLQNVRVNGRELKIEGLDVHSLLGVINNSLPIPVQPQEGKSFIESVREIYLGYCIARTYQKIPYETIRKDFQKETNIDIDTLAAGIFNFIMKENENYIIPEGYVGEVLKEEKTIQTNTILNLNCYVFDNAVELELLCENRFYEKNKSELDLNTIVKNWAIA